MNRYARRGMVCGSALSLAVLIAIAVILLLAEGASNRALVVVWLWVLPFLGVLGAAGWVIGAAASKDGDGR